MMCMYTAELTAARTLAVHLEYSGWALAHLRLGGESTIRRQQRI